jgi:hypothetical protein
LKPMCKQTNWLRVSITVETEPTVAEKKVSNFREAILGVVASIERKWWP